MIKRSYKSHKLELRSGDNVGSPILSGYGFCFNETTEDGVYGKERFDPGVKIDFPKKCFLLRDHDKSKVLARRGKNLTINKDDQGLFFSVNRLPDTQLARETRALIKDGLVEDVSIGFLDIDSDLSSDGVRTYKHIQLHELSILPYGYFESGSVEARSKRENKTLKHSVLPPECIF